MLLVLHAEYIRLDAAPAQPEASQQIEPAPIVMPRVVTVTALALVLGTGISIITIKVT